MIKAQVVSEVVRKTGISKADVQLTVEVLFQTIQNAMVAGEKVHFRGFGSFANKKRAKKIARNITQNTALIVEEHYVPSFHPAKAFAAKIKAQVKVNE
ncbi:MAG: HU family DNA-binding protein [Bacteroidota bacterium]